MTKFRHRTQIFEHPVPTQNISSLANLVQATQRAEQRNPESYRLLELNNHRVCRVWYARETVSDFHEHFQQAANRKYRMEKIPAGQKLGEINDDEVLVTVYHFHNYIGQTHGIPFLIKLGMNGVYLSEVKEEIKSIINKSFEEKINDKSLKIGSKISEREYSAFENLCPLPKFGYF